jgi:hypothetical protein
VEREFDSVSSVIAKITLFFGHRRWASPCSDAHLR